MYCTQDQLIERYGEGTLISVTDRAEEPTGTVDTAAVSLAIAGGAALIDGYLKSRYQLPLAAIPPLLTDLALTIAIYRLHAHVAEEKIRKDYEDAMRTLREIASGVVRLDIEGAEPTSSGTSGVRFNDPHRPLSADSMKGFI